jgi:uncharacterized protein (TIGR00299 family) protein
VSRVLYLDCVGGAAGDMLLSALVDAGADRSRIEALPEALGMPDVRLNWIRDRPGGFAAQRLEVAFDAAAHPHHRGLADMLALVDRCDPSAQARTMAETVFRRLAEAEAAVHGATLDTVHFHEVGGVDALIDILGAAIALDDLGVERIICSPLPMGSGTVQCAHGTLPLPAPAVAAMLPGIPVRDAGVEGETVTPTGAALVTALADAFGPMPAFTVENVGIGAGSRSYPNLPNIVRAFVGSAAEDALNTTATGADIVECNVDDLDPRVLPVVIDQLMDAGAMDASITPIVMKKGRPGHLVSALCAPERTDAVVAVLLHETTSLGCRIHHVDKRHLSRRMATVTTPWGDVPVKVALDGDRVLRRVPEFEDCAALARKAGVPVRDVLTAASSSGDPE